MSIYCLTRGQCFARTFLGYSSMSQNATVSKPPVASSPRENPPIPLKRSKCLSLSPFTGSSFQDLFYHVFQMFDLMPGFILCIPLFIMFLSCLFCMVHIYLNFSSLLLCHFEQDNQFDNVSQTFLNLLVLDADHIHNEKCLDLVEKFLIGHSSFYFLLSSSTTIMTSFGLVCSRIIS